MALEIIDERTHDACASIAAWKLKRALSVPKVSVLNQYTETLLTKMQHLFKCQQFLAQDQMSRVMRKPTFCICENEDADQLRGNHKADHAFVFAT